MAYECVTSGSRPELAEEAAAAFRERWPEFIFHDPVPPAYMPRVQEYFSEYDMLLLQDGRVVAGGWGVPFGYEGEINDLPEGYDAALVRAVNDHEAGRAPSAFSFMAAVHPDYDRQGLVRMVLEHLSERVRRAGMRLLFAPLRPTWKSRYPTVPMRRYATWMRVDGLSIDPWIRTHQRQGARIIGPAPNSMVIPGTVQEWERWTGMAFPESGKYVVPGALNELEVDWERDRAVYREENLWVEHDLGTGAKTRSELARKL
jgi:GNAT superfamily N-acetyltransferase